MLSSWRHRPVLSRLQKRRAAHSPEPLTEPTTEPTTETTTEPTTELTTKPIHPRSPSNEPRAILEDRKQRDDSQPEDSLFFQLPGELRNAIYEYYLLLDFEAFEPVHAMVLPDASLVRKRRHHPLPALMVTCRRARLEMVGPAASRAAIRVVWAGSDGSGGGGGGGGGAVKDLGFHGCRLDWARLRALRLTVAMRKPRFLCWSIFFGSALGRCVELRELAVDWHPDPTTQEVDAGSRPKLRNDMLQLREIGVAKFLMAVAQVATLRTVSFRGEVPEAWIEWLEKHSGVRVFRSSL